MCPVCSGSLSSQLEGEEEVEDKKKLGDRTHHRMRIDGLKSNVNGSSRCEVAAPTNLGFANFGMSVPARMQHNGKCFSRTLSVLFYKQKDNLLVILRLYVTGFFVIAAVHF